MNIDENGNTNPRRFRLSAHDYGSAVSEDQLELQKFEEAIHSSSNSSICLQSESEDSEDKYEYDITFNPFRIEQRVNGHTTMVANKKDTLLFEDYSKFYRAAYTFEESGTGLGDIDDDTIMSDCFYQVLERMSAGFVEKHFGQNFLMHP